MKLYPAIRLFLLLALSTLFAEHLFAVPFTRAKPFKIVLPAKPHPRALYGARRLEKALLGAGYHCGISMKDDARYPGNNIYIGKFSDMLLKHITANTHPVSDTMPGKEGFLISGSANGNMVIAGADESGILYGCLELAGRIAGSGKLPGDISFSDRPEMVLRGTCIGVQKSTYLPGRNVYEYPYTPETFPWFYDKSLWIKFLDSMVDNRMNSLYLWNGHPFASLVKLKDYPYAVEVDEATFKKNEEVYRFLTEEADKRGIWVIQMFYNIIVSKPFAEKNHMKTQDRERPIIPIIADYTRKSIAAFVEKYPNVGLLVCLGEAMEGVGQMDIDWFTQTIIPGVKDGLKALGQTTEPPIVLRAHDTNAPEVMKAALPIYKNLYTEAKFNGEALTTYEPRGEWAQLHRTLSRIGTVQIENVHILANLEPFRYGSADFIRKSVLAMHNIMEGNGLHLYPQASYWDWPYSADKSDPRLLQMDRDWIWYKEWSRYAWNCHRDSAAENGYWSKLLADKYGCTPGQGKNILEAYEQSGQIAPKLLRRYGITDGNRQTLTLGMLMTQLINPFRFGLFTLLYDSESPEGEKLIEYAEKESKGEAHTGETPVQVAREVMEHGQKAVEAIDKASMTVTADKPEFLRLKNDMHCYKALAGFYAEKALAAIDILRFKYSNHIEDLDKAVPHLEKSVAFFKKLTDLTKGTYLYANSMQTQQRKIPMRGVNGTFKTWEEMLPVYEKELDVFKFKIDSLRHVSRDAATTGSIRSFSNASVDILSKNGEPYIVAAGSRVYADTSLTIKEFAKELGGLRGIQMQASVQSSAGTVIEFTSAKPVQVLIGYFNSKEKAYLKAPELETNALANDYGQAETKIANAVVLPGMPSVNIHTYSFGAGKNKLVLPKGLCLVLGFMDENEKIKAYDAGLYESGNQKQIDWLFE